METINISHKDLQTINKELISKISTLSTVPSSLFKHNIPVDDKFNINHIIKYCKDKKILTKIKTEELNKLYNDDLRCSPLMVKNDKKSLVFAINLGDKIENRIAYERGDDIYKIIIEKYIYTENE